MDQWIDEARKGWRWNGSERPPFAVEPVLGQESVWDFPRPPRLDPDSRTIEVRVGPVFIARTRRAIRVLETASPPTVYIPPDDVDLERIEPASGSSFCEWKGAASYWSVVAGGARLDSVAWSYPRPFPEFEAITGYFSFYPARIECYLESVRVEPQPGGFYGGWITPEIVGPFKGEPGSGGW